MSKEKALVVCPGRGTYGASELGYLARHHAGSALLAAFDRQRNERAAQSISELDCAARFSTALHGSGANASPLIYAAGILDYLALDTGKVEVVAICGNSMGWYTALACAGAVSPEHGFAIADGMGVNSGTGEPGGQLLLTLVGDDWRPDPALRREIDRKLARSGAFRSIELGGMLLVAGEERELDALLAALPAMPGRPPLRLAGHGPFHTALMAESSRRALAQLPAAWFGAPRVPLIDGEGRVWRAKATTPEAMHRYTFTTQILEPYDFTRSLAVGIKEFAPDRIVLLGPGDTMGGAIGQVLVAEKWLGIFDKAGFAARQAEAPFVIAMGREDQRARVTRG
ncbi:ACP S-malonyltransferase [Novosphingobium sp. Gsoil 351]|uniref:ACP S-malonyltransferase n=1 Tax=Novosphingobium sp. Gsoil 351 TaxID=2675225 RepID=UPI0012B47F0E|nr:ACP S-malonyltransferase [Novosphingobium sp. Gsoil 351]QGN53563.1 ACP S-malonyltransferase [Novosphingobium sp. Gsoil 351]